MANEVETKEMGTTFAEEFPEAAGLSPETTTTEGVSTDLPTVPEKKEKETYALADGTLGSRAAFIREKFLNDNMSRKEIAETFGFNYRVVYSATVNMTNEAEAATRGRASTNTVIKVNSDNKIVEVKEIDGAPVTFVNGEAVDITYSEDELTDKTRNDWIKEMVNAGMSRGDVAKILDVSYGVVYGLTKEADSTRTAHTVELEDGTVMPRAEYIRMRAEAGVSKSDIAKELNVPYSVVWQATKVEKSAQDKFNELLEALEKFKDKVVQPDSFESALSVLREVELIPEENAEASKDTEVAEEPTAE